MTSLWCLFNFFLSNLWGHFWPLWLSLIYFPRLKKLTINAIFCKLFLSSTRQEPNYAATLASIIVIFIVCHLPRLTKTVYEIVFIKLLKDSGCSGLVNPAKCLAHFNNFILVINASSGFLVYCFIGSFGTKFLEVLTARWRQNPTVAEIQLVNLPQKPTGNFLYHFMPKKRPIFH